MKFSKKLAIAAVAGAFAMAGAANAHVWNIGWKSVGGGLTFYGVSYHGGTIGGTGSVDDFVANPAGLIINGTSYNFDTGSATDLNDCSGPGGVTSGTCSPGFNALGLDGAIASIPFPSDIYGKYATKSFTSAQLAAIGIGAGNNAVTLTSFSPNVHWAGLDFASATVPINIVVTPAVPLPAGLPLIAAGLGAFGLMGWRKKRKA